MKFTVKTCERCGDGPGVFSGLCGSCAGEQINRDLNTAMRQQKKRHKRLANEFHEAMTRLSEK